MNKLVTFKRTLIKSLTDPMYYRDILRTSIFFSIKYIFFLLYLIFLVKAIWFSVTLIPTIPKIPNYIQLAKQSALNLYPKELTLTFNNGTLRTNVDEPYIIPFPKQFRITDFNLAVIDTKSGVENITRYNTLIFITKDSFAYYDKNPSRNSYKVQSFADQKGYVVINYEVYQRFVKRLIPYFDYLPYLLVIGIVFLIIIMPIIVSPLLFISIAFGILFLNLFIFVILKILRLPFSYKKLFQLGLHAVTFPLIFSELQQMVRVYVPNAYILSYLLWMAIVLHTLNKNESKKTSTSPV